jgi:hypothetical protein
MRANAGPSTRVKPRSSWRLAAACLCCAIVAGCGGIGGTIGGGSIPPEISFRVEGTPNTVFSGVISDTVASWPITGVVPLNIIILKDNPPVLMTLTKLTADPSLLSIAIFSGGFLLDLSSTTAPFGTTTIQTDPGIRQFAPRANPDTRFFVEGAPGEFFDGLIEDLKSGFALGDYPRCLFLFENPQGRVDGHFNLPSFIAGPLQVNLSINGRVVASAHGIPSVSLKSP